MGCCFLPFVADSILGIHNCPGMTASKSCEQDSVYIDNHGDTVWSYIKSMPDICSQLFGHVEYVNTLS